MTGPLVGPLLAICLTMHFGFCSADNRVLDRSFLVVKICQSANGEQSENNLADRVL